MCNLKSKLNDKHSSSDFINQSGFTLIELVVVIVILGILSAFAIPRFAGISSSAQVTVIEGVEGSMRSTIGIVRSLAYAKGLSISSSNPSDQSIYIVQTEAGNFEVDWRNLCPESRGELGDSLTMSDHIGLSETGGLTAIIDNRYTRVGYDIRGSGPPTTNGCYVTYDSFGDPDCTVISVIEDC